MLKYLREAIGALDESEFYTGPPLEKGGTSISGDVAPGVAKAFKTGIIKPGMKVLDYGAGRAARNADWLRAQGVEVYAFDPFHSTGGDGWEKGSVVKTLPPSGTQFDVFMSIFVLNVIPKYEQDRILGKASSYAPNQLHVVRKDLFSPARKALTQQRDPVWSFFLDYFAKDRPDVMAEVEAGEVSDATVREFLKFGYESKGGKKGGFQRDVTLEDEGYRKALKGSGWAGYVK